MLIEVCIIAHGLSCLESAWFSYSPRCDYILLAVLRSTASIITIQKINLMKVIHGQLLWFIFIILTMLKF
eukprot:UN03876